MKMRNALLAILGLLLIIVLYRALTTPPEGAFRKVPERLQGVWITSNQEYSDRFLELGADFITFGTGGVNSRRFEVTGIDESRDPTTGRELFVVYFKDVDGSRFSREFSVHLENKKELVFVNQPDVVWEAE